MTQQDDLQRFITAQKRDYETALLEIKQGRKQTHWMWYIFPQMQGLGRSFTSQYYGIKNLKEAKDFLENPYLSKNLYGICEALLLLETNNPTEVFGKPDDKKLCSSMTLFAIASEGLSIFQKVLEKYFSGKYDSRTKRILQNN